MLFARFILVKYKILKPNVMNCSFIIMKWTTFCDDNIVLFYIDTDTFYNIIARSIYDINPNGSDGTKFILTTVRFHIHVEYTWYFI